MRGVNPQRKTKMSQALQERRTDLAKAVVMPKSSPLIHNKLSQQTYREGCPVRRY
jgi:hypothetical protein